MINNIFRKTKIKYTLILLMVFVVAFSNFISFLPVFIQKNQLSEYFKVEKARAAANGDGLIIYGISGNTTPQFRFYNNAINSFGAETGATPGTQPVIVRTKSSSIKEEFIAAYQDNTGNLRVMCYDGSTWSNEWSIAVAPAGAPTTRRFDIAYESNSGDVTVAYSKNTAAVNALAYRTKSGGIGCGGANWSAAANFPATSTITSGTALWVKAVKDERTDSDLSAWIWADSNRDLGAAIWSGTAFTNLNLLETNLEIISVAQDVDSFELAHESLSGDLMVVWGSGGGNGTNGAWYNTCAGGTSACAWSAKTAIPSLLDDATVLDLSADPASDQMAFSSIGNAGSDLQTAYWNGSSWTSYANRDTSAEAPIAGSRLTQTGWITNGSITKWITTYDDANGAGLSWYMAIPGSAPVKQTDWAATPAINDIRGRYEIDNNPFDSSRLMLTLSDSTNSIYAKALSMDGAGMLAWIDADDGASLGTKFSHPQQGFSFAYRRFIPAPSGPDATSFINNNEGALADGGRSNQQITVTGTGFGAGPSDGTTFAVKIGAYIVPDGNITTWSATAIIFTIPAAAAVYGGTGTNGLIIRAGGVDDATPLDFYIYPNITSASTNSEQIGTDITALGDHFGTSAGSAIINTKSATVVGAWSENSLTLRVPGQEEAINITGKIQITRSDSKTSNLFPSDPANFTILAPSVSGSSPASATTDQILPVEFTGQGIDTDAGTSPTLKLINGQPANCSASATCIIGTFYIKVTDYQKASASFDLSAATAGTWDLVIVNDDGQSGTCGGCFTINPPSGPVVSGINPAFGLNSETADISSVSGSNFQSGAAVKLVKTAQVDIDPLTAFSFTNVNTLSNGAFDLTGKVLGFWNVVVTNPDLQIGSYGNESTEGFEIRSALPSNPSGLSQSKTEAGSPLAEGTGVGGQLMIYLRIDMEGGSADDYTPEIEVKPYYDTLDGLSSSDIYIGASAYYDPAGGIPAKGFIVFSGTDGESYHWRARVRNSSGLSAWTSFGSIPGPGDKDFYLDNTAPSISLFGGDCLSATTNITDLSAVIGWNTSDSASGGAVPSGPELSYSYTKVQYIETVLFDNWINPGYFFPSATLWKDSPHQVTLSGLSPNTSYIFRIISEDSVGNIGYSGAGCEFSTESSYPIKTIELFILQESAQNVGSQISKPFSVYIPESPGTNSISVKSAFIEITGISSAGSQEIDSELQRNSDVYVLPGTTYSIDSIGTTTPFVILFDALDPAGNNQDMKNITDGGQSYDYTLYLNGNGIPVSVFSAKLVITYTYKP